MAHPGEIRGALFLIQVFFATESDLFSIACEIEGSDLNLNVAMLSLAEGSALSAYSVMILEVSMSDNGMFPINDLYVFPSFQTRDDYFKATGEEAPDWDPNRPVKSWFDPAARNTNKRTFLYDLVLMYDKNGMVIPDENGVPQLDQLALLREEAARVNILPRERMVDYGPGSKVAPIPVPMRSLKEDEELVFTFGGVVAVRFKSAYKATVNAFTVNDRQLLAKIAQKLGVV